MERRKATTTYYPDAIIINEKNATIQRRDVAKVVGGLTINSKGEEEIANQPYFRGLLGPAKPVMPFPSRNPYYSELFQQAKAKELQVLRMESPGYSSGFKSTDPDRKNSNLTPSHPPITAGNFATEFGSAETVLNGVKEGKRYQAPPRPKKHIYK